jgi:hypothetical protein
MLAKPFNFLRSLSPCEFFAAPPLNYFGLTNVTGLREPFLLYAIAVSLQTWFY